VKPPVRTRVALAQNFFRHRAAAQTLVRFARLEAGERVYDLGAGTGMVTRELIAGGARVIAVERDPNLAAKLHARFGDRATVLEADLVEVAFEPPFKVVANLPYNLTAVALRRLLFAKPEPEEAFIVLQREAAEKYAGLRHSRIGLLLKPWFALEIVHAFARDDFVPRPGVDSVVLHIVRRASPLLSESERPNWEAFIRYAFARSKASARLTFRNVVSNLQWRLLSRDLEIAPDSAVSGLSPAQWLGIYRFVRRCAPDRRQRLVLPTPPGWGK